MITITSDTITRITSFTSTCPTSDCITT